MKKQKALVIVAHPDDETLYFGGLIQQMSKKFHTTVVCVTNANADGHGKQRKREFTKAVKLLGAQEFAWLGFPDVYQKRLDHETLRLALRSFVEEATLIFSHSAIGEYGHPHHQDVSHAVHALAQELKKGVYSPAYNAFADRVFSLTAKEFGCKTHILTRIYGIETQRFLHLLPATFCEGFLETKTKAQFEELAALYKFMSFQTHALKVKKLRVYKMLYPQLIRQRKELRKRPF